MTLKDHPSLSQRVADELRPEGTRGAPAPAEIELSPG